jgi:hypothetical protein
MFYCVPKGFIVFFKAALEFWFAMVTLNDNDDKI